MPNLQDCALVGRVYSELMRLSAQRFQLKLFPKKISAEIEFATTCSLQVNVTTPYGRADVMIFTFDSKPCFKQDDEPVENI
jgi:hypothetical protein